jgi:hypothetical protein
MSTQELAEFWRLCDFGVARYLQAAMERVSGDGGTMPAPVEAAQMPESPRLDGVEQSTREGEMPEGAPTTTEQPQNAPTEESNDGDS